MGYSATIESLRRQNMQFQQCLEQLISSNQAKLVSVQKQFDSNILNYYKNYNNDFTVLGKNTQWDVR